MNRKQLALSFLPEIYAERQHRLFGETEEVIRKDAMERAIERADMWIELYDECTESQCEDKPGIEVLPVNLTAIILSLIHSREGKECTTQQDH